MHDPRTQPLWAFGKTEHHDRSTWRRKLLSQASHKAERSGVGSQGPVSSSKSPSSARTSFQDASLPQTVPQLVLVYTHTLGTCSFKILATTTSSKKSYLFLNEGNKACSWENNGLSFINQHSMMALNLTLPFVLADLLLL